MRVLLTLLCLPVAVLAQAGHWSGAIQVPDQELKVEVDLAKASGEWAGAIAIPAQNMKAFPLSNIRVEPGSISFTMKGIPGDPEFHGKLASNGNTMTGDFTQGGGTIPFALTRTGEARLEAAPKSTPIGKELEGTWQGTLDAGGQTLRLVLKLANGPNGATGSMISLDQNGVEFPVTAITQDKSHLKLDVPAVNGTYEGDWAEDTIKGQWTQGKPLPLIFKKSK